MRKNPAITANFNLSSPDIRARGQPMRKNPAITANYNRDCDIGGVTVLFSAQIFSQVRKSITGVLSCQKIHARCLFLQKSLPPARLAEQRISTPCVPKPLQLNVFRSTDQKNLPSAPKTFSQQKNERNKKLLANRQPIFTGVLSVSHIRVSASAYHNNNFCFFRR